MDGSTFIRKIFSKYLIGNILAMCIVVVILLVVLWFGIGRYTHHGEEVIVPDVKRHSFVDARELLMQRGLNAEVVDTGYIRNLPPDYVLEQSIEAGQKVKAGRVIYLTINSGKTPTLTLPDVIDNSSLREAMAKLKAMGFKLGEPQYIYGERDWVYGITMRGRKVYTGDKIPVDAILTVQVGNGQRDDEDTISYVSPEENYSTGEEDPFEEVM